MKKFLVLYRSSATAADQIAAGDQAEEAMGLWISWMEKARSALVDPGSPLGDTTEFPSSGVPADRHIGGYTILQGETLKDIETILDDHPHYHSPNASIEVHEFLAVPGMS